MGHEPVGVPGHPDGSGSSCVLVERGTNSGMVEECE
jgi:hypothetical protein